MAITPGIIEKLLLLLKPWMKNEKQRRGYLIRALGSKTPVLDRLCLNAPMNDFITSMVEELEAFGTLKTGIPAICALLLVIHKDVGVDVQADIDELIVEIRQELGFPAIQTLSHLLFDRLLNMDFKEQVNLVKNVIKLHRIAAFLVHGEAYCGQQLLVTRLLRLNPQWNNISPIKIDLSHRGVGSRIPYLWGQLAKLLKLKDAQPNQIIESVCDRLLTQDVIFIFHKVDYMLPEVLTAWLQEFWEPLVERVKLNYSPTPGEKHLLMFLVDYKGSVCQSNIVLAEQSEQPEYPRIPLHLPPISPFPPEVLDDWINDATVHSELQILAGLTAQVLLDNSDKGTPELVYEEICSHCGLSWEGKVAQWLI